MKGPRAFDTTASRKPDAPARRGPRPGRLRGRANGPGVLSPARVDFDASVSFAGPGAVGGARGSAVSFGTRPRPRAPGLQRRGFGVDRSDRLGRARAARSRARAGALRVGAG